MWVWLLWLLRIKTFIVPFLQGMASVVDWFRENVHLPLLKNGISISLRTVKVNNSLKKPGPVFLGQTFQKNPIPLSIPFPILHPVPSFFTFYSTQPFPNLPTFPILPLSLPPPLYLRLQHPAQISVTPYYTYTLWVWGGWVFLQWSSMLSWPGMIILIQTIPQ